MKKDIFKEIEKYSKDEIIQALKNSIFKPEIILSELPLIRYNTMCDKAEKIGHDAKKALEQKKFDLCNELFDKSNKMYEKANIFINKENK